ncbi:hypothetical protein BWD121_005850 [Bartonella sp. WD12.1]|nr:hypothetical protein BWD121_005850 [Bartonella sp. WD12.1]
MVYGNYCDFIIINDVILKKICLVISSKANCVSTFNVNT